MLLTRIKITTQKHREIKEILKFLLHSSLSQALFKEYINHFTVNNIIKWIVQL